jgi:hypothetical protein
MGQEQSDSETYEWVNAWAASAKAEAPSAAAPARQFEPAPAARVPIVAAPAPPPAPPVAPQLLRDIAEIEMARDALEVLPVGTPSASRRTQTLALVPSRTSETLPVILGGVILLVMLMAFGAAAAMTTLVR